MPNAESAPARKKLSEVQEQLADVLRRSHHAYLVTDHGGRILDANAAAERLLQSKRKELYRTPLTAFTEPAERSAFRTRLNLLANGKDYSEWRWTVCTADGVQVDVVADVAALKGAAHDGQLYWILRQVAKAAPRARPTKPSLSLASSREGTPESTRALPDRRDSSTVVLAIMSHEIRTPLQAVVGYAEILQSGMHGALTETQQRDVDRIIENVGHVQWLLNNMIEFSRLGQKSVELQLADVAVDAVIEVVAGTVRPLCNQKSLHLELPEPLPHIVMRADPERLHQILVNLLANAIKFSGPGGTVRIDCTETATDVMLVVSDNGPGVPRGEAERIFEPFVRLSNVGAPGAGLGLAICRTLARRMNGDVSLIREYTGGAAFLVRLPKAAAKAVAPLAAKRRSHAPAVTLSVTA